MPLLTELRRWRVLRLQRCRTYGASQDMGEAVLTRMARIDANSERKMKTTKYTKHTKGGGEVLTRMHTDG